MRYCSIPHHLERRSRVSGLFALVAVRGWRRDGISEEERVARRLTGALSLDIR